MTRNQFEYKYPNRIKDPTELRTRGLGQGSKKLYLIEKLRRQLHVVKGQKEYIQLGKVR